ncbi:PilZ domain-containing protein [Cytobacillus sp. FJAT-54145]|uniref:PilZ domain-containing protein n=1 Tax=Cytobacillus spartinae TaxID=3299023 RepID=A0ABW6KH31_9BACI
MVMYKREEPFRFQFQNPIPGTFKLLSINGVSGQSKAGSVQVLDVSPNGLKFKSTLDLPIERTKFLMEVSFLLNDELVRVLGEPKWKKREGTSFVYGFVGIDDEETKKEIIERLKQYAKKISTDLKNKNK